MRTKSPVKPPRSFIVGYLYGRVTTTAFSTPLLVDVPPMELSAKAQQELKSEATEAYIKYMNTRHAKK